MPASHCEGFSCCGAWALGTGVSVVAVGGLSMDHGLSCSAVCGIFLDRVYEVCVCVCVCVCVVVCVSRKRTAKVP